MPDEKDNADHATLTLKDRADLLMRLAENAQKRFEERRQYEWKICFGVWTSLAAGSGLVLGSTTWNPGCTEIIGVMVIGVVLFLVFWKFFVCWIHGAHKYDKDVRDFWFGKVEQLLDPVENNPPKPSSKNPSRPWLHPIGKGQIAITFVFCALIVGAVWSKSTSQQKASLSEIVIKGRDKSSVVVHPEAK